MTDLTRFRVYFVRHGQSEANLALQWQGWGDAPLTPLGLSQARATGQRLAKVAFDGAWSSDRTRALETAQAVLENNGKPVPVLRTSPQLRERFYGGFECLTTPEVLRHYPRGMYDPKSGQSRMEWRPGGGESLSEVVERILGFLQSVPVVSTVDVPNLLLVSHGNVLRLMLAVAQGLPEPDLRIPANASVLILEVKRSAKQEPLAFTVLEEPHWEES